MNYFYGIKAPTSWIRTLSSSLFSVISSLFSTSYDKYDLSSSLISGILSYSYFLFELLLYPFDDFPVFCLLKLLIVFHLLNWLLVGLSLSELEKLLELRFLKLFLILIDICLWRSALLTLVSISLLLSIIFYVWFKILAIFIGALGSLEKVGFKLGSTIFLTSYVTFSTLSSISSEFSLTDYLSKLCSPFSSNSDGFWILRLISLYFSVFVLRYSWVNIIAVSMILDWYLRRIKFVRLSTRLYIVFYFSKGLIGARDFEDPLLKVENVLFWSSFYA